MNGTITSPPFSDVARIEAGTLIRIIQNGGIPGMPLSRPMPSVGTGCHELRVRDEDHYWRIVYAVGPKRIAILAIFAKKTQKTPPEIIEQCRRLLRQFREEEEGGP